MEHEERESPTDVACAGLVTGCSKGFPHHLRGVRNGRAGVGIVKLETLGTTPIATTPSANLPLVSSPMV